MDSIYYYWLSTVEGLGIKKISHIIQFFGCVQNAWDGSIDEFKKIKGILPQLAEKIVERRDKNKLLKEIRDINSKGINIITIDNEDYPNKLKNIYDPPYILFIKGKLMKCSKYIAVVGSRKCTSYGRMAARNFAKILCSYDIGIISGMARGIDTEAHRGALEGNGITFAVLGCGCDIVYPPENKKLSQEIEKNGALISEYPPGIKPFPSNFPARNRIISGLSDGVLVIEAGEKSGALITVNYALEHGREVFAVPGNIYSEASRGTNNLIKDGAKPITDISDILSELNIYTDLKVTKYNDFDLTGKEKILMEIINDSPIYIDDLLRRVSLKISEINYLITNMELKGIIRILPGKYIVRTF